VKFLPRRSPFGLIQEDVFPSEWLVLVCGMLLNQTSRKQIDRVFPMFVEKWSSPVRFIEADRIEIETLLRPLGLASRRTKLLFDMTKTYLTSDWAHARELPGVGTYGSRSWEIFCVGTLGDEEPRDRALTLYWKWARKHERREKETSGKREESRPEDEETENSGHQRASRPRRRQEGDLTCEDASHL